MKRVLLALLIAVSGARADSPVLVESAGAIESRKSEIHAQEESKRKELALWRQLAAIDAQLRAGSVTPTPINSATTVVAVSPNGTPIPYHFPISPTIADLRVGITTEQCRLILGNPLRINGDQWVYARGYIYMRDGKVDSMQNKAGGVFAAEWK